MTARFIGRVVVEQDGPWWVLHQSIVYEDDRVRVYVPEGFVTDFASVPRVFWSIFPPTDAEYSAAAVVHDRLYETHEGGRKGADATFYRAMAVHGTPNWKRWLLWAAVRAFGWSAYWNAANRQVERLAFHTERMRRVTPRVPRRE